MIAFKQRQRWVVTFTALAAMALSLSAGPSVPAQAAPAAADTVVYFPETGHTVGGLSWRFWRERGALDLFGYPLTEPFDEDAITIQYFQRARFELRPESEGLTLALLGAEASAGTPPLPAPEEALPDHTRFFPPTGHFVTEPFVSFYLLHGAEAIFGFPIAEADGDDQGLVQWFQRGRLEWLPETGVRVGLVGAESASDRGVDTAPVAQPPSVPEWWPVHAALVEQERRLTTALASIGSQVMLAPGERWIEISIAQQRITAWEGDQPVFSDLVSTGKEGKGLTPPGVFTIQRRVYNETMDSRTIGLPPGHPLYYRLENVLYTQYFTGSGIAIHYAWWHNNFGQPMSFGCVNLRLSTARWFWDWAATGTKVVVY